MLKPVILLICCMSLLAMSSCDTYLRSPEVNSALAKIGDQYLYRSDIPSYLFENNTPEDSTALVNDFINQWAAKQLLIQKALLNLPQEKIEAFDRLVANYKADLYTQAYKEALVHARTDPSFSEEELKEFYLQEKQNFRLKERLLRLRFVKLPIGFKDLKGISAKLKSFREEDILYLDSISIQFHAMNLNDSLWVPLGRIIQEIPPFGSENAEIYLKKSQFFELQDSLEVYLGQVVDMLQVNDTAPLSYIRPTLEQVLEIRKKQEFVKQLERDIINEAIKNKNLELFN